MSKAANINLNILAVFYNTNGDNLSNKILIYRVSKLKVCTKTITQTYTHIYTYNVPYWFNLQNVHS